MRFEKLKDSSLLRPGELLVVLKIPRFSNCKRAPKMGFCNSIDIVRNRFQE